MSSCRRCARPCGLLYRCVRCGISHTLGFHAGCALVGTKIVFNFFVSNMTMQTHKHYSRCIGGKKVERRTLAASLLWLALVFWHRACDAWKGERAPRLWLKAVVGVLWMCPIGSGRN